MKKTFIALAIATLMAAPVAHAVESHHSGGTGGGQMQMMDKMQSHMQKMMKEMEQIHATKDPEKRQQLIDKHMESMREGMKMMRGMGSGGMMMGGKTKGMAMGGDMESRMKHLEERMDMMQMMMEQMVESRSAQRSTKRHDHRKMK